MTTDNGFQPDRPPIFLSEHTDETGHPEIEKSWDLAAISSRILKASALAAAVTTIGVGALSVGNPVLLVANVTDWWNDKPALQLEADTSASTIQTMANVQDAPAATDEPAREEVATATEPAAPNQAEAGQRQTEPVQVQAEPPRPAEVAQSQSENTANRSPKNCSSNSRPGRPRKRRVPGPRELPARGWRRIPRHRRGPRKSNGGSTRCKMPARKSARNGNIAPGSARSRIRANRSRPWPIPGRTGPGRAKRADAVVPAKPRYSLAPHTAEPRRTGSSACGTSRRCVASPSLRLRYGGLIDDADGHAEAPYPPFGGFSFR